MELDVSNDREIERLGANATAEHAMSFWMQLSEAARKDALELDPLWQDEEEWDEANDHDEKRNNINACHTTKLVLTENLTYEEETRFYRRFRSNFSPIETFSVLFLHDSFLYGEYTRPKWSALLLATHGQLTDFNFITLLRRNAHDIFWMSETDALGDMEKRAQDMDTHALDNDDGDLLVVSRAQWLFIELARCREGCYGKTFRQHLQIFDLKTSVDSIRDTVHQMSQDFQLQTKKIPKDRNKVLVSCWNAIEILKTQWPFPSKRALVQSKAVSSLKWAIQHVPSGYPDLREELLCVMHRWKDLICIGKSLASNRALIPTNDTNQLIASLRRLCLNSSATRNPTAKTPWNALDELSFNQPSTTSNITDLIVDSASSSDQIHSTIEKYGIVIQQNAIRSEIIQQCLSYGMECLDNFQNEVLSPSGLNVRGNNTFDYTECRQRPGHRVDNRHKILAPNSPIKTLSQSPVTTNLIESLFGDGMDYQVLYGGIVHSFPSDDASVPPPAQIWHRDGPSLFSSLHHHPTHCLNIFIPLIDVSAQNGCTEFFPGSHCDTIFEKHCKDILELADGDPTAQHPLVIRPEVPAGTIIAFDIRVMHRGLSNLSREERPLLYFTIARSWWHETHMFKNDSDASPSVGMLQKHELEMDTQIVSSLYAMVTGVEKDIHDDYGHPHYTDRFDLLLLEDITSEEPEIRLQGKRNLSACMAFMKMNDLTKLTLMNDFVSLLEASHSQRIQVLEQASKDRKKMRSESTMITAQASIPDQQDNPTDFTSIMEDMSDVTILYKMLASLLFADQTKKMSLHPIHRSNLDRLGFSVNKEGVCVMLAVFKAQCFAWSSQNNRTDVISVKIIEEAWTSWWHGGNGRFTFQEGAAMTEDEKSTRKVLVVFSSLGSGLARPEWGGSLAGLVPIRGKVDVLNVLDPAFSWYQQDPSCEWNGIEYYRGKLRELVKSYEKVMFLGDSMGGAAALLFADIANQVLVFTPQIDITTYDAITRKDFPLGRKVGFSDSIASAVSQSKADIKIHYGLHCPKDVDQVSVLMRLLDSNGGNHNVTLVPHNFNDHVLSLYLRNKGELRGIIQDEITRFINE